MPNCTSCGSEIPEGQGRSCSMCFGDVGYGRDGYYQRWVDDQIEKEQQTKMDDENYARMMDEQQGECQECGKSWYFCVCSAEPPAQRDDF